MQPVNAPVYPAKSHACQSQPTYNAVKIDVHNPTVSVPGAQQNPVQNDEIRADYAPVTNPYYNYPQASVYDCPQCQGDIKDKAMAPIDAAASAASADTIIKEANELLAILAAERAALNAQKADLEALKQQSAQQPQVIQQQNINAPAANVPSPQIVKDESTQKADNEGVQAEPKSDVKVQDEVSQKPQIDLNEFIAKLGDNDYEVQATAMEAIASLIKENPKLATELLDEKIVNALQNIIKNDSSKLEGPNAEQIAARKKLLAGEKLTEKESQLANTVTPMEQSERNKSYAMFTLAIMQKLYGDEVKNLSGNTVPLTELPAAADVVEQLTSNPNPMVRASAIEALSYIQQPEYKEDLKALFNVAVKDQDVNVQETAKAALEKLDALAESK